MDVFGFEKYLNLFLFLRLEAVGKWLWVGVDKRRDQIILALSKTQTRFCAIVIIVGDNNLINPSEICAIYQIQVSSFGLNIECGDFRHKDRGQGLCLKLNWQHELFVVGLDEERKGSLCLLDRGKYESRALLSREVEGFLGAGVGLVAKCEEWVGRGELMLEIDRVPVDALLLEQWV